MIYLKQSTASQSILLGPFIDDTDGKTAETALTINASDVRISKNGGNMAAKNSGGGTHDEAGWYTITLDATDTNTCGRLQVSAHVTGALPVWVEAHVLEEAIYDALFAASADAFDSNARIKGVAGTKNTLDDLNDIAATAVVSSGAITTSAGAVSTVTSLTSLPAITAGWLTAAGIAASALNGKGDWNTTAPLDAAATRSALGLASANLDTQLADLPTVAEFNARTLLAAAYFDPSADTVTLANGAHGGAAASLTLADYSDFTGGSDATAANQTTIISHLTDVKGTGFVKDTHSLTDVLADVTGLNGDAMRGTDGANTTTPPTVGAIADQVWVEQIGDHSGTAGSTAEALNAAGAAGDPWVTALPGAYGAGSAGNIVGNLNDLDAAGVRSALGLASANLDTQLADLPTVAEFNARTLLAAAYFDPAADTVTLANGAHGGAAASLTLASYSNFKSDATAANQTAISAAITALNDLSSADAQAAAVAAIQQLNLDHLIAGSGTVDNGDASATSADFKTDLTDADNFWNCTELHFITGANAGITRPVSLYSLSNGHIELPADHELIAAPADGDAFLMLASTGHTPGEFVSYLLNYNRSSLVAAGTIGELFDDLYAPVVTDIPASIAALNDISEAQVNAQLVDVLNVDTLIDGKTIAEALQIIAASTAGELSGAGTGTEVCLGLDGVTVRLTGTIDGSNNRTAMSYA